MYTAWNELRLSRIEKCWRSWFYNNNEVGLSFKDSSDVTNFWISEINIWNEDKQMDEANEKDSESDDEDISTKVKRRFD